MKERTLKTKLLTVLLALCMVLSIVPMTVFAATPATATADFTASDNGAEAIALLNRYKTAGAADSTWNSGSKTLTLKGIDFITTAPTAVKLPERTTIVLADGTENAITGGDARVMETGKSNKLIYITALYAVGDLTVKGNTGTLSVTSGTHTNTGDAWTYSSAIFVDGDFVVDGGHVTATGGKASSDDCAFSNGVLMDSSKRNKILQVSGGSLTAVGGESVNVGTSPGKSFSNGVYILRGDVSATGNGKLTAKCDPVMNDGRLTYAMRISSGDLSVSNEGEIAASAANGIEISGGGILQSGGKITVTRTSSDPYIYGNAIVLSEYMSTSNTNTENTSNIKITGGEPNTVNGDIVLYTHLYSGRHSTFTMTGGTVNAAWIREADQYNISGGMLQAQRISGDEFILSNATVTLREPIHKDSTGELFEVSALSLQALTVNSGTLDVAWDWGENTGENTPIVVPPDEDTDYPQPLVSIWPEAATFNGGTSVFDTGYAGNIAIEADSFTLGQGMVETGASVNRYHYQKDSSIPVKIAPGTPDTTISSAAVENVRFNYQAGDAPQKTASVGAVNSGQYEVAYECWEEMENGEPVAFWYSDESKYTPSMKKITQFEEGKTYMYSIELKQKDGYTFADNCSVMINGNPLAASANVVKTVDGLFAMNVETIRPQATKEISVIEINNATLTFKDGDKPVFTGTVPENDQYAFRCEWWSLDENTGIVSTEPEWGGDIYNKKITAFEAGKTYHYGVYVTAYTADISPDAKLKINGREVEYTRIGDESDTQSFWVETDLTMTPTAAGASDYKIIEGANGTWTQNSDGTLTFRANGDFSKFTGVKVDGTLIDAKNYTAVSGSTVITLKADYLKTLSVGTHKITVVYTDGECSANFEVKKAASEQTKPTGGKDTTSPQTGDNSNLALWFAVLFVSGAGILGTTVYSKKKKS